MWPFLISEGRYWLSTTYDHMSRILFALLGLLLFSLTLPAQTAEELYELANCKFPPVGEAYMITDGGLGSFYYFRAPDGAPSVLMEAQRGGQTQLILVTMDQTEAILVVDGDPRNLSQDMLKATYDGIMLLEEVTTINKVDSAIPISKVREML